MLSILRNAGWNLAGQLAPLIAAIFCIPLLMQHLGPERFGLLTLIWVLVGYFSFFDLGMGRALTQLVAKHAQTPAAADIPSLALTATACMAGLGLAGSLLLLTLTSHLVQLATQHHSALLPIYLAAETQRASFWLAATIPLVVLASALRGFLEGYQRFRALNLIRIPTGVLLFAAPVLLLPWQATLEGAAQAIFWVRLLSLTAHVPLCRASLPEGALFTLRTGIQRRWLRPLLHTGGWMTVSNVIGPLIVYADRFLVGALVSAAAVGYYATAFEVASRLLVLPAALAAALFPAFSSQPTASTTAALLFERAFKGMLYVMLPLAAGLALWSQELLNLWLGQSAAQHSAAVLRILSIGLLFNCLAQLPFAAIQARNRAYQTGLLHLAELLPYAGLVLLLTQAWGIAGAALAWSTRSAIDALALLWLHHRAQLDDSVTARGAVTQPNSHVALLSLLVAGSLLTLAAAATPVLPFSLKLGLSMGMVAMTLRWLYYHRRVRQS